MGKVKYLAGESHTYRCTCGEEFTEEGGAYRAYRAFSQHVEKEHRG